VLDQVEVIVDVLVARGRRDNHVVWAAPVLELILSELGNGLPAVVAGQLSSVRLGDDHSPVDPAREGHLGDLLENFVCEDGGVGQHIVESLDAIFKRPSGDRHGLRVAGAFFLRDSKSGRVAAAEVAFEWAEAVVIQLRLGAVREPRWSVVWYAPM